MTFYEEAPGQNVAFNLIVKLFKVDKKSPRLPTKLRNSK